MYSLSDPLFWINFVYFCIAATLAFFIPGNLLVRKLKTDFITNMLLSIVTGFVIWTLLGFLLGYLHIRNLSYLYVATSLYIWIRSGSFKSLKKIPFVGQNAGIYALLCIGTIVQLSSVLLNGITTQGGAYFCCGIPDTITHLALTSELVRQFPPHEPGFSGIPLTNYHYLSNLGTADFVRTFGLPLVNTQYQFMTVLFSILLGVSAIALSQALQLGRRFTFWFMLFLYFCGDIIFLLPAFAGKPINFSLTTLENASTLWISPPRFYSLIVLLTGLTLFVHWLRKKDIYTGVLMAIVLGSIIGFKVYVGLFVLSGFLCLSVVYIATKKFRMLWSILVLYTISFILYVLVNKDAGGLIFTGFWRFEDFVVQPSLGISSLELARRVFVDHYDFVRAYLYDIFFAFLYLFFSSGTLLLGLIQTKESIRKIPNHFTVLMVTGLVSTCFAGFFYIQNTGGANSSQFLISIYIVGTLYAALAVSRLMQGFRSMLAITVGLLIVLGTTTRVLHDTYQRIIGIKNGQGVFVSNDTLKSYKFFTTTDKNSVVMMYDDSSLDCLFITFIGKRPTYSCLIGMPGVIGDSIIKERNTVKETVFFGKDVNHGKKELKSNKISYIYIQKDKAGQTNIEKLNLPIVYDSGKIVIYRVND